MAEITKEWIEEGAVDGSKITLENDQYLKSNNQAGNDIVNIIKVNASDRIEFASVPQVSSDASADNDLVRKSQFDTALGLKLNGAEKGAASGVCPLGADSKVAATYLPSYVDDVLEYANLAAFPSEGEAGKIYVAIDNGKCYRWSGTVYVEVSPNDVNSVNGETGIVVLDTDDIGEGLVNLYYTSTRFDNAFSAKTTDGLAEGLTNLYHTTNRARSAAVVNSSVGTETDQAMSVAASKSYIATEIGNIQGAMPQLEVKTLSSGDITNGYVDLAYEAVVNSVKVWPVGGPLQTPAVDYTLSYTGGVSGVTRLTFAGDLSSKLVENNKIVIDYLRA